MANQNQSDAGLCAENLEFRVGNRQLISQVSLSLHCGEVVAIIGPNGAGKSTLMRLLTGYLSPNAGECRLFGKPLSAWSAEKLARTRAVMRQHAGLAFPFRVKEVVAMGRTPYPSHKNDNIITQVMEQTDCLPLAERNYQALSGGEQQRVQLARCLAQLWQPAPQPHWLFLDEPTSALDLYHQQKTLRLVREMTRRESLGVCCILHDLNLTALYADRVFLPCDGKLVAQGTPEHVLTQPIISQWYHATVDVVPHPEIGVPQVFIRR